MVTDYKSSGHTTTRPKCSLNLMILLLLLRPEDGLEFGLDFKFGTSSGHLLLLGLGLEFGFRLWNEMNE